MTLDAERIDEVIELLSDAARMFEPTRLHRFLYQALSISVDLALGCSVIVTIVLWTGQLTNAHLELFGPDANPFVLFAFTLSAAASLFATASGVVLLFLNLPLFLRSWRQRLHLQRLGIADLSGSLDAVGQRRGWYPRFRNTFIAVLGLGLILLIPDVRLFFFEMGLVFAIVVPPDSLRANIGYLILFLSVMLFAAWRLGWLRERLALATDVRELSHELKAFRDQVVNGVILDFPDELAKRIAQIEAAQIARGRQEAIHQSTETAVMAVAVAFEQVAQRQRERLGLAERGALEDLVDTLSAAGIQSQDGAARTTIRNSTVEVDYVPAPPNRIRITAVRNLTTHTPHTEGPPR
jgi:hypothetical protein